MNYFLFCVKDADGYFTPQSEIALGLTNKSVHVFCLPFLEKINEFSFSTSNSCSEIAKEKTKLKLQILS